MVVINQLTPIYVSFAVAGRYLADVRRYQAQKPLTVLATMPSAMVPGAQTQAAPSDEGAPAGRGGQPRVPQCRRPQAASAASAANAANGRGAAPEVALGPDTEQGRVTFIDNAVDPTTGTIKLKGTFENRNRQLWPGLFVRSGCSSRRMPARWSSRRRPCRRRRTGSTSTSSKRIARWRCGRSERRAASRATRW